MMKKRLMLIVVALLMTTIVPSISVRAEVSVVGQSASGLPGQRVFLELIYDYGAAFNLIAEELTIAFPQSALTFVKDASTTDLFGQTRTLGQYETFLGGGALANLGTNFYYLSFSTTAAQPRSGVAHFKAAFDIPATTLPGRYPVPITGLLYDESECCDFALQNLSVTVTAIPEPKITLMWLPGLALIVLYVRIRGARRARLDDARLYQ